MHFSLDQGLFDLALILIGFLGRSLIQFRTPAIVICLFIDMAKWYMKTHPDGIKCADDTCIDEKMHKLYPDAIG